MYAGKRTMPRAEENLDGPRLDPVGALIYYLCVTVAIEGGAFLVPSSHHISRLLAIRRAKNVPEAVDHLVQSLWQDLWWIGQQTFFDERPPDPSDYWRSLAQHNVNARMQQFGPALAHGSRERRINPKHFVEGTRAAVRLIALKELYRSNGCELPHPILWDFLQEQNLLPEDQFPAFLQSMSTMNYISVLPDLNWLPKTRTDITALIEPSSKFRNQDKYLELRALDYFSPKVGDPIRRIRRLEVQRSAQEFLGIRRSDLKRASRRK
jgi:hypothetical protein